jgi:hypothetical protein
VSLFVSLVADGWCWFVLREKYCRLVADGWFVLREKYCWLVADKPNQQGACLDNKQRASVRYPDRIALTRHSLTHSPREKRSGSMERRTAAAAAMAIAMLLLLEAPPMAMATRNLHATEEDMDMQPVRFAGG